MGIGEVILIVLAVLVGVALVGSGIMWLLEQIAEGFTD